MRSYLEIARRIAKIIVSPETAIGFADGVLSVPTDIGYLAYGFIDTDSRYQRETEKIRMVTAIKNGILDNENFLQTIAPVLAIFNKSVPEKKQNNIYGKVVASVAGRTVTNSVIAGKLATVIAQRSSLLISLRGGLIGNILLAGAWQKDQFTRLSVCGKVTRKSTTRSDIAILTCCISWLSLH